MITSIQNEQIVSLLKLQLGNHFGLTADEESALADVFPIVMERLEYSFRHTDNKYYSRIVEGVKYPYFNPFHSCQYAQFLYVYSRVIAIRTDEGLLADKLYYLNKMMNSADLYHQIELPAVWDCEHPLGSVMGRAKFGNHFFFYQGCTVGGDHNAYPVIGHHVCLFSNSAILGESHIGNHVWIGAGALVKNVDIPDNSLVFGQSPNLIIKPRKDIKSVYEI